MNPITEPALSAAPVVPAYRAAQRVTLIRVVRSEWTKLRSLPSTLWLLLSTFLLVAGGGLVSALVALSSLPHGAAAVAAFDPTQLSLSGVALAELTAGALGVLIMTGEYATGQIRLTLTAVPRRLPVLSPRCSACCTGSPSRRASCPATCPTRCASTCPRTPPPT